MLDFVYIGASITGDGARFELHVVMRSMIVVIVTTKLRYYVIFFTTRLPYQRLFGWLKCLCIMWIDLSFFLFLLSMYRACCGSYLIGMNWNVLMWNMYVPRSNVLFSASALRYNLEIHDTHSNCYPRLHCRLYVLFVTLNSQYVLMTSIFSSSYL